MAGDVRIDWTSGWEHDLMHDPGMKQMLHHAGEIVVEGAKIRAPVSADGSHGRPPGYGRSQIKAEPGEDADGPHVDIWSPAETPDGVPYMYIQEVGSKAHPIDSHGNYPLRDGKGNVFGKHVDHPGTEPKPHLRPALDDLRGRTL